MNKERLSRLLEEPARVAQEDLSDLKAMTERFPWFTGAHFLKAIGESSTGDVLFDETLRTTAAHLPSRAVLFDALLTVPSDAHTPAGTAVMPIPPAQGSIRVETVEPEVRTLRVEVGPPAAIPTPDTDKATVQRPATDEEIAQRILERQIMEAAAAGAYALVQGAAAPEPLAQAPAQVEKAGPGTAPDQRGPDLDTSRPLAVDRSNSRLRFTDWLEFADAQDPAPIPEGTRLDQLAPRPDTQDWLRGSDVPPIPSSSGSVDPGVLIDRFIQGQEPAPQKKAGFFDPQQAGKRSLEEHAELVTETLARIYEKQGNVPKAMAAYKRLAEKYPEKSMYFLSLAAALEGPRS